MLTLMVALNAVCLVAVGALWARSWWLPRIPDDVSCFSAVLDAAQRSNPVSPAGTGAGPER